MRYARMFTTYKLQLVAYKYDMKLCSIYGMDALPTD